MRKPFKHVTKDIEFKVCQLYTNGERIKQIAKDVEYDCKTIHNILKKNSISTIEKPHIRKYCFNQNYFEIINSPDKAYFLGLLMADGCNTKNKVTITLQESDKYILEIFKERINHSVKLMREEASCENCLAKYRLNICSKKVSEDLSKLGCTPAKTNKAYFPNISEHLYSHFIRGVFDGDGCICIGRKYTKTRGVKNNLHFSICGNILLIERIQEILMKECSLNKTKLDVTKRENIVNVHYGGNIQATRIYNYLYKDCEDLFLTRKKDKFAEEIKLMQYDND